ncbi:hypothetical protein QRX60_23995 [Amycolatopsis mongoliensis]|uniref:Uncharacterized protein n=1 Tax=Amycolatopsis mongoliensis TaxID=715475 RepID=A0A9Y2K0P2_9PSEU|nr:hypothetical protein [Amycolatopsis sp. 4-36]WIY06762.1 hypothetical protein QRX60_23995 [Amycolatopsis sp. 4-36]
MPRLIAVVDHTVEVEYGQFVLQEIPMARNALTLPVPAGSWIAMGRRARTVEPRREPDL